jgi:hypothetical protein
MWLLLLARDLIPFNSPEMAGWQTTARASS